MAYRVLNFQCNPNLIPEIADTGSGELPTQKDSAKSRTGNVFFFKRPYLSSYPQLSLTLQFANVTMWATLQADYEYSSRSLGVVSILDTNESTVFRNGVTIIEDTFVILCFYIV